MIQLAANLRIPGHNPNLSYGARFTNLIAGPSLPAGSQYCLPGNAGRSYKVCRRILGNRIIYLNPSVTEYQFLALTLIHKEF